jgi:hypothetical protein
MLPRAEWIVPFLPRDVYLVFALVSREWRQALEQARYEKRTMTFLDFGLTQWLLTEGGFVPGKAWKENIAAHAASIGDLELLQWAHARAYPWFVLNWRPLFERGYDPILRWVSDVLPLTLRIFEMADLCAEYGRLELLEWLVGRKGTHILRALTMYSAAEHGQMEVVQFVYRFRGWEWKDRTCSLALKNGHYEIAEWALENGAPLVCVGDLKSLQWLHGKGLLRVTDELCIEVALCGRREAGDRVRALKWLSSIGGIRKTVWDKIAVDASGSADIEMLELVLEKSPRSLTLECWETATSWRFTGTMMWLEMHAGIQASWLSLN